ncbi:MAG TPA: LuxR C-terminal-related transcriptional regulator, partial [Thermoanaerobaculia bacterium]|nr:LuxR C-terminal-related transcriptional regulator [Thermoanaerobaculia bacterium]
LVIDDYHVIESESVHRIVQRIVDRIPPNLHLILSSRVDPPLALARLRARDILLEIRASDLRFTEEEAEQFFNDAMGLSLTREEVAELERRTEGWAVGLQMAAISLRGRDGAHEFIVGFSGSNRYVLDYLTAEVLQGQSGEVRTFLLETAILGRLSAPLCDAVTGNDDAARILEQLDAANLFLIPLDDVRFWYRYHHLFGSLLQHELDRSASAARIAELHRRAAAWYAARRMPDPALHHAVAAHDHDAAIAIVKEHAATYISAGDGGTLVRWIAQLPRERVEKDFELLVFHSRALMAEYRLDESARELAGAERVIPATGRRHAEGVVLSVRGMLHHLFGDSERADQTLDRAMSHFDPDDFWYSMTSFHIGIRAYCGPDLGRAERYLEQATAFRDRPDGLLPAVLGRAYGGWARLWLGRPDEAAQLVREANGWIDAWAATHGTGRPLASFTYSVLASVSLMWNDLESAREYAELALDYGRTGFFVGYVEALRVLSQVAVAQGDWDAAIAAAREFVSAVERAGNLHAMGPVKDLEHAIRWRRGRLTGNSDDLEGVARWCEESGLLAVDRWRLNLHTGLYPDFALIIAARVLIRGKRYEEARRLVDAVLEEARRTGRIPAQITLLLLRAMIEAELGRSDAALLAMVSALDLAAAPRFVGLLVEEGSDIVPLLDRAASAAADRDFATRVLASFQVPPKPGRVTSGMREPLSDRELDVLRLIAGGASNQEAARKLFVAPSTVKKHLENIYAKLGVGGRTHAVARARELRSL